MLWSCEYSSLALTTCSRDLHLACCAEAAPSQSSSFKLSRTSRVVAPFQQPHMDVQTSPPTVRTGVTDVTSLRQRSFRRSAVQEDCNEKRCLPFSSAGQREGHRPRRRRRPCYLFSDAAGPYSAVQTSLSRRWWAQRSGGGATSRADRLGSELRGSAPRQCRRCGAVRG